jgi:hypothetical protein
MATPFISFPSDTAWLLKVTRFISYFEHYVRKGERKKLLAKFSGKYL